MLLAGLCKQLLSLLHSRGFLLNDVVIPCDDSQVKSSHKGFFLQVTIFPSHSLHFNSNYSHFKLSRLLALVEFRLLLRLRRKRLFLPSQRICIFFSQTNRQTKNHIQCFCLPIPDFSPLVLLNLCQL